MKIFIGSDIHGSAANARRFLDAAGESRLVLLGDIYNHGPRNPFPEGYAPMEVAAMLNAVKDRLTVVKGNCDSEVDEMISEFAILPDGSVVADGHTLYFTHGHKCNADLPKAGLKAGDAVLYGHFHRPSVKDVDGVKYICVGAVGMSPEGVDRSYAVYDDGKICVYSLEGARPLLTVEL